MDKGICCVLLVILPSLVMCNPVEQKIWAGEIPADELSNFYEGDIIADNEAFFSSISIDSKISLWDNARIWPGGKVPYKIFNKEDDENAYILTLDAIKEINQFKCVEVYPNNKNEKDYINIVLGDSLSSQLGHQRNGAQNITITKGVDKIGKFSIVHELMHSLGFGHEHNRPDRDSKVEIMWDNLEEGTDEPYFSIYNVPGGNFSNDNLKYDTMSLMHATEYNPSIAIDGSYAIVIKSKDTDEVISSHKELTDLDIERLKKTYSCDVCTGHNNDHLFRYPGDCTKYYQCDNGKPAVMPCGTGLHINTNVNPPICDYPPQAKCTEFFNLWT